MSASFERPGHPEIPYNDGEMWTDESDRARSRFMHGFIFFSDWSESIRTDTSGGLAGAAADIILEWYSRYPSRPAVNTMAYHDETTAQRLINLLNVREAALPYLTDKKILLLQGIIDDTATLLESEDFHSTGNNHGMFQDLALINYSILGTWRDNRCRNSLFNLGESRIKAYFLDCFTSEGVHRENTPTYHLMICHQLKSHRDLLELISHPDVEILTSTLNRASIFATHSVMPSGKFPPVSDTTQKSLAWYAQNLFDDPEFEYAATRGRRGSVPSDRVLVLPSSGYAIYRSSWTEKGATFAYFHAAYNADYHKHSDDLSFLLTSQGVDLLTEAGPHGYNYKDPHTLFAYGQYAHNNVVVNGKSVRRTDTHADTVHLFDNGSGKERLSVTGVTGRLHGTRHSRSVNIFEAEGETQIDLLDVIESEFGQKYELIWNLGPDVVPVVHGQGFELFHEGVKIMDALMASDIPLKISLHCGQTKPTYIGWRCPTFGVAEPNNAIVLSFGGKSAEILTKFRLKSFNYTNRGLLEVEPIWEKFQDKCSLNYSMSPATTSEGSRLLVVVFSAISGLGDFTYNYRSSLNSCPANILYILDDFGDQGAYYYSDHGDKYIYDATQNLIETKLDELGLTVDNLVTVGSSKGGTAALIHGITAGAANVFVGAPQILIGSFLEKPHPNILEFMTGGTSSKDIALLDCLVFDVANKAERFPNIHILVGERDHHYKNHVLPFVRHMAAKSQSVDLDVRPGLPHAEIGPVFGRELQKFLSTHLLEKASDENSEETGKVSSAQISSSGSNSSISLTVNSFGGEEVSFKLYLESEVVNTVPYGVFRRYSWSNLPAGRYRVRVFLRKTHDRSSRDAFTTRWVLLK
ncbi:heparinase II/III family protein [Arthrobacter sp. TMP15]|uniref:heparinase II/III domain-containing protein n=1 Tax=Arthrobacter sp. TMP15 TaxID=3140789 RepID=UPI0031BB95B4